MAVCSKIVMHDDVDVDMSNATVISEASREAVDRGKVAVVDGVDCCGVLLVCCYLLDWQINGWCRENSHRKHGRCK